MELVFSAGCVPAETEDVSLRGMFILTDELQRESQLIRLQVTLPGARAPLAMCAVVRFVRKPHGPRARPAGMGVQFFGTGANERRLWASFIETLRRGRRRDQPLQVVPVLPPEGGYAPVMQLRTETAEQLSELFTRSLIRGCVMVQTRLRLCPGEEVMLELVHPTSGALYPIAGTVSRRVQETGFDGVVVDLALTPEQRDALHAFCVRPSSEAAAVPELELPTLQLDDASSRHPAQIVFNI